MTRVLVLHGGWPGHRPAEVAAWASASPFADMDVVLDDDLAALEPSNLAGFDLLCLLWTYGEVTPAQERALLDAVTDVLGVLVVDVRLSAFLSCWL